MKHQIIHSELVAHKGHMTMHNFQSFFINSISSWYKHCI